MKKRQAKKKRTKAKPPKLHAKARKEKKAAKHKGPDPQDYQAYLMWSYAT
jgi:hypothetical protein